MCTSRKATILLLVALLAGCGTNYEDLANYDSPNRGIVCLGDSITRGHGATRGKAYPSLLSARIGRPVTNAGVDGNTSGDALRRLERDVLELKPRVVIVMVGGNDVLQRVDNAETLRNVDAIVAGCVDAGAMVVLVHGRYGLFNDPFGDGYKEIAKRHKALLVKDVLDGILGKPSMSSDQIHPNDAGYALLAERIGDAVLPLIEDAGGG